MRLRWVVGMLCVVVMSSALGRAAEDKPTADRSADKAAASDARPEKKRNGRLTKPWTDLSSLSDDQKEKIKAIHAKANDDINAIREKEHAEIVALLSDDQKNQLKTLEETTASAKKTASAAKKEEAAAPAASADAAPASEKKDAQKKDSAKKDGEAAK